MTVSMTVSMIAHEEPSMDPNTVSLLTMIGVWVVALILLIAAVARRF